MKDKVSLTHIAKELSTTATYVNSILQSTEESIKDRKNLPAVINMDEIKSTKHAKMHISFVYMDGEIHKFQCILSSRNLFDIVKYFNRFDKKLEMALNSL